MSGSASLCIDLSICTTGSLGTDAAVMLAAIERLAGETPLGLCEAEEDQLGELTGLTAERQRAALAALKSGDLVRSGLVPNPNGKTGLRLLGGDQP